ncbi:hypothetical protein DFH09DRAFT_1365902 [Mycena vulgaris]|nr:hypothetical protein DFH09DRAFT_1365902 [Mycena vulgaris]
MSASPALHPWPERTAAAAPLDERRASTSRIVARQDGRGPGRCRYKTAETNCQIHSGNEVISCFPTADIVIPQHQWASFVWNSNNPEFTASDRVDIYLFHGDSLEQILFMPDQVNTRGQAGVVRAQVNDSWWGDRGVNWAGANISYPFYWLISKSGEPLSDGTQKPQTTFSAVQTTFADSVLASMASSSASAASVSRTASSGIVTTISAMSTIRPTGSIQSSATGTPFPTWAIILIVLGILLVLALFGCLLFAIRYVRQRDERAEGRHAIRSRPPSMAQHAPVAAAALARDGSVTSHGTQRPISYGTQRPTSSGQERTVSPASTADARPFSHSDAAVMAAAFRSALRRPGPLSDDEDAGGSARAQSLTDSARARSPERPEAEREALLLRGLGEAGEGADIRQVESARGVRVESSEGHGFSWSSEGGHGVSAEDQHRTF